jgi:23S rRNA (adenine2503-C2)-methyltransferase
MTNLVGKPRAEVENLLANVVDRPFRSRQVASWILDRLATSFDEMTNLPKALRTELGERFQIRDPEVVERTTAEDGTTKYLLSLVDGATIECVSMPEGTRATLCLSSQTGCAVGCTFCVTGALGPGRNLTADEMVGQYRVMVRELSQDVERTNLVFMGMGEPLLNTTHLGAALDVLYETVSPRRITVSTSGIVPGIRWLSSLARPPKLAVSLNAPDQARREQIMPIARRYPLDELVPALRDVPLPGGRRITFEYVLIRDFNDAPQDAVAVARLLQGLPSKINVIPLNEDPDHLPDLHRPGPDAVDAFGEVLRRHGLVVTVRQSRGSEVAAACGQLKGQHQARSTTTESCLPALSPSRR